MSQHVGDHSFGALRYHCTALCGFQTSSSHNSDSSGGSAKQCLVNVGMQERSVHVNCNGDAITFWMIVSIMRAHAQHCFQRQCRCRCEHLGLSAPWSRLTPHRTKILTSRNRLSLDRPIASVSLASPAADTRFTVVMTPNSLSEFSFFCPSSLSWDRQGLSGFSFAPSRHSKDSLPAHWSRRSGVCSPCSLDSNPRSPLA